jgi:hypothetical protein
MAELKTVPTDENVMAFLNALPDDKRRRDCYTMLALMQAATGQGPVMWGSSIVGFGSYHYKYASGREGDWFLVGFSPRKAALTMYIMAGFEHYAGLLAQLGKYTTGKACLYVKRRQDINLPMLRELIGAPVAHMQETNRPAGYKPALQGASGFNPTIARVNLQLAG